MQLDAKPGRLVRLASVTLAYALLIGGPASAQSAKKYDPGASDTEIRIGNFAPQTGDQVEFGSIVKSLQAYFRKVNDDGGINGRKINFISYDAYSAASSIEQVAKLVEIDQVLFLGGSIGTPGNTAVRSYLNDKKIPQLFVASAMTRFGDGAAYPWTMGFEASYQAEGRIYAKYILKTKPSAKIAVLHENNDFGRDYLKGLKDGLGARADQMIVGIEDYQESDAAIDQRIQRLIDAKADTFVNFSSRKYATGVIRAVYDKNWKPLHFLARTSTGVDQVMKPAGSEAAADIISVGVTKNPGDRKWEDDAGVQAYRAFVKQYLPDVQPGNGNARYGYMQARTIAQVIKQAGNDLTRENIMRQAASLRDFDPGILLPGIKINTAANDFYPIEQQQLIRYDAKRASWDTFGDIIDGSVRPNANAAVAAVQPRSTDNAAAKALPLPPSARIDTARRVALVIGNSAYRNVPVLANPPRDAAAIAESLRKVGFQSVTLQSDLTRDKLVTVLRDFAQIAEKADWAVVYYAGHGIEVGGVNYLVPIDAKLNSDRDVGFEAVPLDQILNAAERAGKLRLILLDACRDNPFANQMKRTQTVASRSVSRGLAQVEPDAGTLVVYAAKHGETALDGDGGNSPFATAFIKNMQKPGVEVRRLFDNVRDDVLESTKRKQQPFSYGSISGRQDFYFVAGK